MEVCEVFRAGLMADGTVKDVRPFPPFISDPTQPLRLSVYVIQVLYGLPMAPNKIADLSALTDELSAVGASMRILVDHPDQVKVIEAWESTKANHRQWSVFLKVDCGNQYVSSHLSPSELSHKFRK